MLPLPMIERPACLKMFTKLLKPVAKISRAEFESCVCAIMSLNSPVMASRTGLIVPAIEAPMVDIRSDQAFSKFFMEISVESFRVPANSPYFSLRSFTPAPFLNCASVRSFMAGICWPRRPIVPENVMLSWVSAVFTSMSRTVAIPSAVCIMVLICASVRP